ncbi:MAG: DUF4375 domain-containing protein [Clostridia bacterium]|nr:DUF4375 domain-containing protein [Clostridia bacterium]
MLFGVQWYLWLILILAVGLAIFAWSKALKSSRVRRERLKREGAIWKRDYDLRQNFSVLTEEKLKETEDTELLHGVAMNIQVFLENADNMNVAFEELPEEKKYIYTLEYFDEDAKNGLSVFFKNNGAPLVPLLPDALTAVGAQKYIETVFPVVQMYDPDSEVSIDYTAIAKADELFKEKYDSDELLRLAAQYIKNNKEIFLT